MPGRGLKILIAIGVCLSLSFLGCSNQGSRETTSPEPAPSPSRAKVTFVELGSVKCIPCRQMQPVMASIERKYGDQVKVVFHDVWKEPALGRQYGIRLIPTQVFLDGDGKEFSRHEGFLPEASIDTLLVARGLKALSDEQAR